MIWPLADIKNSSTTDLRQTTIDVVKAIALFGIIVLNYHGYLNFSTAQQNFKPSIYERWWHPFNGVLSNPFPVAFVMMAGIGTSLFLDSNGKDLHQAKWRLARRGLFLFSLGYGINWIWRGTILPYYGAFFLIAGVIGCWSKKKLVSIACLAMVFGAAIEWWRITQSFEGNYTTWLSPVEPDTPRNLLIRIFIDYTHPLFPWLTFFVFGILLGRNYSNFNKIRNRLLIIGLTATACAYGLNTAVRIQTTNASQSNQIIRHIVSTRPFDRGILYVTCSIGVVLSTLVIVDYLCVRYKNSMLITILSRAGQMTLTLYLVHIFVFNAVVNWWKIITPTGLDTAMIFSLIVYVKSVFWANWWYLRFGRGPVERVYRNFGG